MKKFLPFFLLSAVLAFCGCSKPVPDISAVRINLVLDIMDLVRAERHADAVVKIRKLRQLEPTNIYLPELELVEKANADLQKVNELLHRDDRKAATEMLQKMVSQQNGGGPAFRTSEQLKDVIRMEHLTEMIIAPQSVIGNNSSFVPASVVLSESVEEFLLLAQKWNAPAELRSKVIRQLSRVETLRKEEIDRAAHSMEMFAPDLRESPSQTILAVKIYFDGTKDK